jgi:hypothetical protein
MINIFIISIILILIFIYLSIFNIDNFVVCKDTPTGPYITYCSLINYTRDNNVLMAHCTNKKNDNKLIQTSLDLDDCNATDGCQNISIDDNGNLTC